MIFTSFTFNSNVIAEEALIKYTLKPGQSLEYINLSETMGYKISSNSDFHVNSGTKKLDYTSWDVNEKVVGLDFSGKYSSSVSLVKNGRIVITSSGSEAVEVWTPNDVNIQVKEISSPAHIKYILKPGQSLKYTNLSDTIGYRIGSNSDFHVNSGTKKLDYTSWDVSEKVIGLDFSGKYSSSVSLVNGGKTIITSSGSESVEVWTPNDVNIQVKEISSPAHIKYILKPGQSLKYTNLSDSIGYRIGSNSDFHVNSGTKKLDYTSWDVNEKVLGLGFSGKYSSSISLVNGGKTIITSSGSEAVEVWTPNDVNIQVKDSATGTVLNEESFINPTSKDDNIYDTKDSGASIILPHESISKITNKETAVQTVKQTIEGLTEEQKKSPTGIDLVTLFAEEAISQASSTKVEGGNIEVNSKIIAPLKTIAAQTKIEMDKALTSQGITIAREIPTAIKLKTDSTNNIKITLDKSILTSGTDKITVESPNISIKIDTEEIKGDLGDGPLIITITEGETLVLKEKYELASLSGIQLAATVKKTYTVNFSKVVKENITVSLPKPQGDAKYQAVIKDDGIIVGGKYNPAKNTIDVKIKESGKYTVIENKKDFTDIKNKSKEMQEAIKVLASKGIINGNTATTFNPDGSISRAEITALIIKTLSKVDTKAKVEFKDIKPSDWYYSIAESSKKYGIINGFDDNTFRGITQIKKDQIIAVAARTLKTEMKYKEPNNVNSYLSSYKDNAQIASWAKSDISLATRENLIIKRVDGNFLGNDNMTRGDAAIIIKRLFDKIW